MSVTSRADLARERVLAADATARQARAMEIFKASGAFLEGHFVYTSGRHGSAYVEKFRVLERAESAEPLCRMIAATFETSGAEIVAGPTTGGIILAYEVGRLLRLPGIFCEKNVDGGRVFRRGFRIEPGQKVLVVDDVVTTGGSLHETFSAVEGLGGEIVGVGVLADRSGGLDLPYPFFACLEVGMETWAPEDCPMCAAGDIPESHRGAANPPA
jgi:orotate phosphoribosyltransferase